MELIWINTWILWVVSIALICDGRILTILRDDKPTIPWPNLVGLAEVVVVKGTRVLSSVQRVKSMKN